MGQTECLMMGSFTTGAITKCLSLWECTSSFLAAHAITARGQAPFGLFECHDLE